MRYAEAILKVTAEEIGDVDLLYSISGIDNISRTFKELVRCKDCKYRPKQTEPPKTCGFSIEFPEGSKCPCQCEDGWYSWYPADNWFCAEGERKELKDT